MKTLNKEFATYKQALALKELGFDEPCFGAYGAWGFMSSNDVNSLSDEVTQEDLDNQGYNEEDGVCLVPLKQQCLRWFRDKHDLDGFVVAGKGYDYKRYYIYTINGKWHPSQTAFDKPEEVESACIDKLIEIVKNGDKV